MNYTMNPGNKTAYSLKIYNFIDNYKFYPIRIKFFSETLSAGASTGVGTGTGAARGIGAGTGAGADAGRGA